jgi:Raf kinase inhibitor-like YbhB/YbcL family protein
MPIPAQLPYASLPEVAAFTVTSTDVAEGEPLELRHASGIFGAGGDDVSPQLSWSGFPPETKSFVVTCYDPDAPTGSGFWHWAVLDIPLEITELATNAGSQDGALLPDGVVVINNDAGLPGFLGAAPPPGHGPHRYVFAVHAMSVEQVGVDNTVSNAVAGFTMFGSVIARATITPTYER